MKSDSSDAALFDEIKDAFRDEPEASDEVSDGAIDGTERVAGYQLQGELHRGGQGVVYKARHRASGRVVALKVLLEGAFASERQRHRFEREIEIAACLHHANIVTLFDSGVDNGRPFYVMQYVAGVPVDEFVSANKLEQPAILKLFAELCQAVSYAHQRGVIHRDLKPANILVDDDGEVHVLDFGLAKLTTEPADVPLTMTGEFVGTLAFASPEQAAGQPDKIDTRTDVYSLGVILHHLLTGVSPYPVAAGLSEALAHISNTAPTAPSHHRPSIGNEVDTIVLKALAKEPQRRYQSAGELGRDVTNYLSGDPIDAKRDSVWYVLRKSLRRYRIAFATGAAFVVVLAVALAVVVGYWRRSVTAEQDARDAHGREAVQRRAAEVQAYIANVAAADAALRVHDVVSASQRLDRAPSSLRNWEWRHLRSRVDVSKHVMALTSFVHDVAFSSDGTLVAGGDWKHQVRVWDARTGKLKHSLPGSAPVERLAFHPSSNELAVAYRDSKVRVWNLASETIVRVLDGVTPDTRSLEFSADGHRLAAAYAIYPDPKHQNSVRIWDLRSNTTQTLAQPNYITSVSLAADDTRALVCGRFGVAMVDLGGKQPPRNLTKAVCNSAVLSRDGKWIVSAHGSNARIWNVATWKQTNVLRGHSNIVERVAVSRDGTTIATGSRDKTIRLWSTKTGKLVSALAGHTWSVVAVAFSPDGTQVVSGGWDAKVRLWPVGASHHVPALRGHTGAAYAVVFAANGTQLVTAGHDKTARIWDLSGKRAPVVLRGHQAPVRSAAASPTMATIATGSFDKTVRLWSATTGKVQHTLSGHTEHVHSVAFSPNGALLASGSKDNTVRIWNAQTGRTLRTLRGHTDHVHTVAFSPDGRTLASSGHQSIRLWDTATWRHRLTLPRSIVQGDFSLAFSPDSRRIAAGANYKTLRVWNVDTGRVEATLAGHTDEIHAAVFSPDGTRLVTASLDGSVLIWDVATWMQLASLHGYTGHINGLSFSPDGRVLAGALADGSVRLWGSKNLDNSVK